MSERPYNDQPRPGLLTILVSERPQAGMGGEVDRLQRLPNIKS
jgi:hypothetical protein